MYLIASFILLIIIIILYFSVPQKRAFFLKPLNQFDTNLKVAALTFDDGPSEHWTPLLLDLLKKYNVRASFFVVGEKAAAYPDIVLRIQKEGHVIGEHTYFHEKMIFRSPGYVQSDLLKTDALFRRLQIGNQSFFRPPYGAKILVLPFELKRMNKMMITWNIEPKAQYKRENYDSEAVSSFITDHIKPGSIILLHDGWTGNPAPFLKAVEKTILSLKKKGYRFITIDEGLNIASHRKEKNNSN